MAKPKLQVLIDWNDDGDFSDSDEDVTADVDSIAMDHLRDMQTEYMNGAVLDMTLKNDDHKYSPPLYPTSPGIQGLKPGRAVWVRMWYPYDAFGGASGQQLAAHTPDEDGAWSWVEDIQNFDQDGAGTGAAQTDSTQGNGDCVATLDFLDADAVIAANFKRGTDTTDHGGLCLRFVDSSNYAYVRVDGSNIELRKVIAGSDTQVATASHSWGTSTTKFLVVMMHGTNIRVLVDNVQILTATMNDAAINAGTKHGLFSDDEADHKWDDFGGFRSVFKGVTAHIRPRPRKGAQYCHVQAVDDFDEFKRTFPRYWNAFATAAAIIDSIALILTSMDYPSTTRQFDAGTKLATDIDNATATDQVGIKGVDGDMLETLYRWQQEENGFAYVAGYGYLHLEDRDHRGAAPHTVSKATLKDTYDGTNPAFVDFAWDDGSEGIENMVHLVVRRGIVSAADTLMWENEQAKDASISISFNASETKDFIAEVKDYDTVTREYTAIAENTDYEANTAADGSGTDISSELTVAYREITNFGAKFKKIRVTFGATAGFLTILQFRGRGITLQDPTNIEEEDATSKTDNGQRRRVIDCLFIDRDDVARSSASNRLTRRKNPKTLVDATLVGGDKTTLRHMIQRQLSDRVTVSYSDMGISEDFFIEGESWTISEGGTMVQQVLQLRGV